MYVVATASDGAATGTATSSSVTVVNTAPTAPTIDITPGSPRAGDSLVCSIVTASTDADGDPITYDITWDDGTSILSAATTTTRAGDTVPGSYVGASETWTCEVVADDGTDTSTAVEDYVTASSACDSTREVEYGGRCYYLDGSGGSCLSGYELAPQTVLYTIASSFAGKTYKTRVSDNCCIWNSESDQDFGMTSSCNSAGPFRAGEPTPGGAGCTNVFNRNTYQLTFCRSR